MLIRATVVFSECACINVLLLAIETNDITATKPPKALIGRAGDGTGGELSFVLGQRQQDLGGRAGFDVSEGFSGQIGELFLVDKTLEASVIFALASCESSAEDLIRESVLPWMNERIEDAWESGDVQVKHDEDKKSLRRKRANNPPEAAFSRCESG